MSRAPLPRRRLGQSSLEFTTLGIGTWAMGGGEWRFGWGPQDDSAAVAAIEHGVALGLNWIDTAAVYGNGRSEELVGRALRSIPPADRPYVATKCGRIIQPDGQVIGRLTPESIRAECDASLQRLGVDSIDLYQIHWPDPPADLEEAWSTLVELKAAGKIREMGVSNHSVDAMERLQPIHPIASLQPPYSLIATDVEQRLLPYCHTHGIGVIAYSPLGKGLLTGAFDRERAARLPANDHRSRDPKFQPPLLDLYLQLVDDLRHIAAQIPLSVGELALLWILRRPEVTSAIVGARHPQQLDGVIRAAQGPVADEWIEQVNAARRAHDARLAALGTVSTGRV